MVMKVRVFLLFVLISASVAQAQDHLVVFVDGLKNDKGSVRVGLFDNEADYLKKAIVGKVASIKENKATVVFEDLEPGTYALGIIHDENENGKLDTNGIGIPKEGFGFGNNAMGLFGPPSFKNASITLKGAPVTQKLKMRYF